MKIYPDTKVYIFCPGNAQTGGPELCHQFASMLISFGVQAYMLYVPILAVKFNPEDPVHDAYKKYHVPYTFSVEENPKNIFGCPRRFYPVALQQKTISARAVVAERRQLSFTPLRFT